MTTIDTMEYPPEIGGNFPGFFFHFDATERGDVSEFSISDSIRVLTGLDPLDLSDGIAPALALVSSDDRAGLLESVAIAISQRSVWSREFRYKRADGSTGWLEGHSFCREDPDGGFRFGGYMLDITRHKEAEARLVSELKAKTLRMKELNHRVKNNMATVISLLELQSATSGSDEVRASLRAAQERVRSVLLLYQELESAEERDSVQADHYLQRLLPRVVDGLTATASVELDVQVSPLRIGGSLMSTIALIVNEGVTNALKYAFEDRRTRRVAVHLQKTARGTLKLTVRDNGRGIADGAEDGFGMTLIRSLSEQIRGDLSIRNEHGTTIELEFPESA